MLILVRHGQSVANERGLLVGRTDVELTTKGRDQARSLINALAATEQVLTSPLSRARETARLAVPQVEAQIDDAFVEQDYGTLDGCAMADVPRDEWASFRHSHGAALGGGESLVQVDDRVHRRLAELIEEPGSLARDPHRHLVVFSHVSPIKSAVAWALGVDGSVAWRLRLDNASLTTVGVRDEGPYLVSFNDLRARSQVEPINR